MRPGHPDYWALLKYEWDLERYLATVASVAIEKFSAPIKLTNFCFF